MDTEQQIEGVTFAHEEALEVIVGEISGLRLNESEESHPVSGKIHSYPLQMICNILT
jgi:hypothetical protein